MSAVRTNPVRDRAVLALASAYFELVTESASAGDAIELATSAALMLDERRLPGLCRAVSDPFAWQPFLRQLQNVPLALRTSRIEGAQHRLRAVATELLREQGLGLVRPEDLLARPTPFEEAFASLSTNTI